MGTKTAPGLQWDGSGVQQLCHEMGSFAATCNMHVLQQT